jgi:hypothetical protein
LLRLKIEEVVLRGEVVGDDRGGGGEGDVDMAAAAAAVAAWVRLFWALGERARTSS